MPKGGQIYEEQSAVVLGSGGEDDEFGLFKNMGWDYNKETGKGGSGGRGGGRPPRVTTDPWGDDGGDDPIKRPKKQHWRQTETATEAGPEQIQYSQHLAQEDTSLGWRVKRVNTDETFSTKLKLGSAENYRDLGFWEVGQRHDPIYLRTPPQELQDTPRDFQEAVKRTSTYQQASEGKIVQSHSWLMDIEGPARHPEIKDLPKSELPIVRELLKLNQDDYIEYAQNYADWFTEMANNALSNDDIMQYHINREKDIQNVYAKIQKGNPPLTSGNPVPPGTSRKQRTIYVRQNTLLQETYWAMEERLVPAGAGIAQTRLHGTRRKLSPRQQVELQLAQTRLLVRQLELLAVIENARQIQAKRSAVISVARKATARVGVRAALAPLASTGPVGVVLAAGLVGSDVAAFANQIANTLTDIRAQMQLMNQARQTTNVARRLMHEAFQDGLDHIRQNWKPQVRVDTTNFNRAIREFSRTNKRALTDVVNQQAYWVALHCIKQTYMTNASKIRTDMSRPSRYYPGFTLAESLVISAKREKGEKNYNLQAEAQKLINAKIRSIGFLKYSWIPALRIMQRYAKMQSGMTASEYKVYTTKSTASPAMVSLAPMARLTNNVQAAGVQHLLQDGVNRALAAQSGKLEQLTRRALDREISKFNRK
jgi:hypothetical protein